MKIKKNGRIAWGVTLIVFGVLFLVKILLPNLPDALEKVLFDFRNYPIYAGIIFLIFNKNKNPGIVLISIGILLRISYLVYWFRNAGDIIWPVLMIIAGILLILRVYRNDVKKD